MGKFPVNGGTKKRSNWVKTWPREGHMYRSDTLPVPVHRQNNTQDKFPRTQFIHKMFQALVVP